MSSTFSFLCFHYSFFLSYNLHPKWQFVYLPCPATLWTPQGRDWVIFILCPRVWHSSWHREGAYVWRVNKVCLAEAKQFKMTTFSCGYVSSKDVWLALSVLNGLVSYSDLWEGRDHYYTDPWLNALLCILTLFWKIGGDPSSKVICFFRVVAIEVLVADCRHDNSAHSPWFKLDWRSLKTGNETGQFEIKRQNHQRQIFPFMRMNSWFLNHVFCGLGLWF